MDDDLLRSLFDHAGVGIALVAPEGRYLRVNRRMGELFGYSESELTGLTFLDVTHPEDRPRSAEWHRSFVEDGRDTVRGEKRCVRKDSGIIFIELTVTPVRRNGELSHFVAVYEDVSQSKRAAELLGRQKQVLELMARNASLHETLAGIVRLIEEQEPGVLSTIYLIDDGIMHLGAAPSFPEAFARVVDGGAIGPLAGTCGAAAYHGRRIISTDVSVDEVWGTYRDWIMSYGVRSAWSTPVLAADGTVLGTVSMCNKVPRTPTARDFELVDVATHLMGLAIERTRKEHLIVQQQAKLVASSKMAALGEMAGGLAHEINNPLAVILAKASQLEMLAGDGELDTGSIVQAAEKIRGTAMRISGIVKGLRSFARDAEHDPFQTVPVHGLIADTLELCRERFKNHDVDLRVRSVDDTVLIECRPVQLVQVLLNLLSNSYDAVLEAAERWIELGAELQDEQIVFSVRDSGPGIPDSLRDKITQPFFTTKEAGKGTGLGLSIASGIVTSHRGTLALDTASPHTQMLVRLPRRQRE